MRKASIVFLLVSFLFCAVNIVSAETGVSQTEILIGQVAALSGPTQNLGNGMKNGMEAYFKYINDNGGINGRKIRLISYDDGYEPTQCVEQTRKLINDQVFALVGYVGTPTAKVAVPIAEETQIPFIGAFTGAEFLRNPVKHCVLNVRGSYFDETEGLVKHLTEDLGVKEISCFYQDDAYGRAGYDGVKLALDKRSMKLSSEGTYERNTTAVKGGLMRVKQQGTPEAIIMIGAYSPCAEFIKLGKQVGMTGVRYCNVSFVGSDALKNELGEAGAGVIISQVVPFPWDTSIPVVEEYQRLLKQYAPDQPVGFVSMEGFITAKFFVEAVKAAGTDLTREGLISAVERKGNFDLGGITLTFSANDHQGMDAVNYTLIENNEFKSITAFR